VLERARLFADDGVVRPEHLPDHIVESRPAHRPTAGRPALPALVDDDELRRLAQTTTLTRQELAQRLGISERTLYRRLKSLE
jgi:transcriptional regulator of acetoin/glycerol metabolism